MPFRPCTSDTARHERGVSGNNWSGSDRSGTNPTGRRGRSCCGKSTPSPSLGLGSIALGIYAAGAGGGGSALGYLGGTAKDLGKNGLEPPTVLDDDLCPLQFPKDTGVKEAALLLIREKNNRYTMVRVSN